MSSINWNYMYPVMEANDNTIVMAPVFVGFEFHGYQVVKGNWKKPDVVEYFLV